MLPYIMEYLFFEESVKDSLRGLIFYVTNLHDWRFILVGLRICGYGFMGLCGFVGLNWLQVADKFVPKSFVLAKKCVHLLVETY